MTHNIRTSQNRDNENIIFHNYAITVKYYIHLIVTIMVCLLVVCHYAECHGTGNPNPGIILK